MCKKGTCDSCSKTSWWGCGEHIPMVMDPIPEDQWCTCSEGKVVRDGKEYPPKAARANPLF